MKTLKALTVGLLLALLPIIWVTESYTAILWVTDSFTRGDSTDLGSDWTPIDGVANRNLQIVSNKIRGTGIGAVAVEVYTSQTFNPNQRAQVRLVTVGAGSYHAGVYLRSSVAGILTGYYCLARNTGGSSTSVIGKVLITGFNDIVTENVTTWAVNDIVECSVIGTTLTLRRNGAVLLSTTDSDIPSGNPGVSTYQGTAVANTEIDDFYATSGVPDIFTSRVIQ